MENLDTDLVIADTIQEICLLTGMFFSCFTGETLVSTEEGLKRIDNIEEGDYVWAENVETGEKELKEVKKVYVKKTDEIVHLTVEDVEDSENVGKDIAATQNIGEAENDIVTTANHPFYVEGKGWVAAGNIKTGDRLRTADGKIRKVSNVTVEKLAKLVTVYNLEVEGLHTYYVSADEVLVHNAYGKSSVKYKSTADFWTNIENRNGKFYTDKATIDKIGQIEARGEDFSLLDKKIMSSRISNEGGTSIVCKYSDELGTKYLIHEVTDARGYIIHRDFDAVRISSGQLINKGH